LLLVAGLVRILREILVHLLAVLAGLVVVQSQQHQLLAQQHRDKEIMAAQGMLVAMEVVEEEVLVLRVLIHKVREFEQVMVVQERVQQLLGINNFMLAVAAVGHIKVQH
jgi:hypothetical protein